MFNITGMEGIHLIWYPVNGYYKYKVQCNVSLLADNLTVDTIREKIFGKDEGPLFLVG